MNRIFQASTRLWIYGICIAAFGVLTVYKIINLEEAAAWTALASAVCGLAYINTEDKEV